jgi:CRISPR-associated endonuclease Csy4
MTDQVTEKMDAYIDIVVLPDPEFPATTLMSALFGKFHRGLVRYGEGAIGVSFPDVHDKVRALGNRLRLHGALETLRGFQQTDWLTGMRDHVSVSTPATVPANAHHRVVRRVQAKSSPERQRRRLITRKGISAEQAMQTIPDSAAERLNLPYLVLTSQSTGQRFRLFVEHLAVREQAVGGEFSAYGLSSTATIPWF